MKVIIISSDFELVIPCSVREQLEFSPGQKLQAFVDEGRGS